jgi:hypothetical protein
MKNYPKRRKCPENSLKAELIRKHGLEAIQQTWYEHGMYKAARILETSPQVVRHIVLCNGWTRPLPPHLQIAMKRGNWKTLITNFKPIKNNAN